MLLMFFVLYGTLPNRWYHVLAVHGKHAAGNPAGDLIVISPIKETIQPGMILTLAVDGELVTHRLVGFTERGEYITRGDSNLYPDQWTSGAELRLIGQYRLRIPLLGYMANLPGKLLNLNSTGSWFTDKEEIRFHLTSNDWNNPNPPLGNSGTSISAEVTAVGFKDTAVNLAWVNGQVCVKNGGELPTEGLAILDTVQYKSGSGRFQNYFWLPVSVAKKAVLAAGEEYCYPYEFFFEPLDNENAQYRNAVAVTILNHSGWLPGGPHCDISEFCPFGPTEKIEFFLPEDTLTEGRSLLMTTATITTTPTPTATATFTLISTINGHLPLQVP